MHALWKGLKRIADSNNDELITIEDWVDLLRPVDYKNRTEPQWFDDYCNFMFKLFDVSGDGVLDLAEYTDGMNVYGYNYSDCHKAFEKFAKKDENGNQRVTPKQWEEYFLDYFFNSDQKALGNHLFGVMKDCN